MSPEDNFRVDRYPARKGHAVSQDAVCTLTLLLQATGISMLALAPSVRLAKATSGLFLPGESELILQLINPIFNRLIGFASCQSLFQLLLLTCQTFFNGRNLWIGR